MPTFDDMNDLVKKPFPYNRQEAEELLVNANRGAYFIRTGSEGPVLSMKDPMSGEIYHLQIAGVITRPDGSQDYAIKNSQDTLGQYIESNNIALATVKAQKALAEDMTQPDSTPSKLLCLDWDNTIFPGHMHAMLIDLTRKILKEGIPNDPRIEFYERNGEQSIRVTQEVQRQFITGYFASLPPEQKKAWQEHMKLYSAAITGKVVNGNFAAITSFTLFPEMVREILSDKEMGLGIDPNIIAFPGENNPNAKVLVVAGDQKEGKPTLVKRAAERFGLDASEGILIDDSAPNIKAAEQQNIRALQANAIHSPAELSPGVLLNTRAMIIQAMRGDPGITPAISKNEVAVEKITALSAEDRKVIEQYHQLMYPKNKVSVEFNFELQMGGKPGVNITPIIDGVAQTSEFIIGQDALKVAVGEYQESINRILAAEKEATLTSSTSTPRSQTSAATSQTSTPTSTPRIDTAQMKQDVQKFGLRDNFSRADAERTLATAENNSYLLRPSSQPGTLALSYKDSSGQISHHTVAPNSNQDGSYVVRGANGEIPLEAFTESLKNVFANSPTASPSEATPKPAAPAPDSPPKSRAYMGQLPPAPPPMQQTLTTSQPRPYMGQLPPEKPSRARIYTALPPEQPLATPAIPTKTAESQQMPTATPEELQRVAAYLAKKTSEFRDKHVEVMPAFNGDGYMIAHRPQGMGREHTRISHMDVQQFNNNLLRAQSIEKTENYLNQDLAEMTKLLKVTDRVGYIGSEKFYLNREGEKYNVYYDSVLETPDAKPKPVISMDKVEFTKLLNAIEASEKNTNKPELAKAIDSVLCSQREKQIKEDQFLQTIGENLAGIREIVNNKFFDNLPPGEIKNNIAELRAALASEATSMHGLTEQAREVYKIAQKVEGNTEYNYDSQANDKPNVTMAKALFEVIREGKDPYLSKGDLKQGLEGVKNVLQVDSPKNDSPRVRS